MFTGHTMFIGSSLPGSLYLESTQRTGGTGYLQILKHFVWGFTIPGWQCMKCWKKARQGGAVFGTQVSRHPIYLIKVSSLELRLFCFGELIQNVWCCGRSSCVSVQAMAVVTSKLIVQDLEVPLEGPNMKRRKAETAPSLHPERHHIWHFSCANCND